MAQAKVRATLGANLMQTRRGGGKAALFALTPEPADDKPTAPASSAVPEAAIKSGMFVEKGTASPVGFRPSQWTFDRPGETAAPLKAEDVVPARANAAWTPTKQQLDLRRSDEAAAQGETRASPLALVPPFAEAMDPPAARAPQPEATPVPLQLVTPSASPPKPKRMIDLEALARKAEALRQELAAAAEDQEAPASAKQPAAPPAIKTSLSALIVDDEDLIDTRGAKPTFDAARIAALLKPVPEGADSETSSGAAPSMPDPALEERVGALEEKVDALVPVAPVLALLDKSGIAHLLPKPAAPAAAPPASSGDAPELEDRVEALEEKVDSLAPAAPVLALLDKATEILPLVATASASTDAPLAAQETAVRPAPAAEDATAAVVDIASEPETVETPPAAGSTVVRLSLPSQFLARITPVLAAFGFMASRRTAAPKKNQPPAATSASREEPSTVVEITVPHDTAPAVADAPEAPAPSAMIPEAPAATDIAPAPEAASPLAAAPVAPAASWPVASWPAPQETVSVPVPPAPVPVAFPPMPAAAIDAAAERAVPMAFPPMAAAIEPTAERNAVQPVADTVARPAPIADAAAARVQAEAPVTAPAISPAVRLTLPSVVVPPVAPVPARFGSFARPAAPVAAPDDQPPAPIVVPAPAADVVHQTSEAAIPAQVTPSEIAAPVAPQPMQAATPRFVVEIPVIAEDVPALSIEKLAAEAGDLARRMMSPSMTPEASPFAAHEPASDAPVRAEPVVPRRPAEDRVVEDRAVARRTVEKPVADGPALRQPGGKRRVVPGTAYNEHAFDAAPFEEPVAAAPAPKPTPKPTPKPAAERRDGYDAPAEEPVLDPEEAAEKEALLADLGAAIDSVMSKRWYGTGNGALQAVFAPPRAVATQIVTQSALLAELAAQAVPPAIPEELKDSGRLGIAFFYGCLCLCGAIVGYAFWHGPLPITQTIQEFVRLF